MTAGDWRSAEAYDYVRDLDPADMAWEFLRRNPEYRQDFDRLAHERPDTERDAALLHRWGLRFRERSEQERR